MDKEVYACLGIDPGVSGGWAVVDFMKRLKEWGPTPARMTGKGKRREMDVSGVAKLVHELSDRYSGDDCIMVAVVEKQIAMPRQRSTDTMNLGESVGVWYGAIAMVGAPIYVITSQKWRKAVLSDYPNKSERKEGQSDASWKAANRKVRKQSSVQKVYDEFGIQADFSEHDLADAALLALCYFECPGIEEISVER